MSSPPKDEKPATATANKEPVDLKGGHAPAVKMAGGVRITQHKQPPKETETTPKEKDEEFEEPTKPNPNDEHKVIISGVVAKGDKDFPPEAVKSFHEKPLPTKEVQQPHVQSHHHINQPRKQ